MPQYKGIPPRAETGGGHEMFHYDMNIFSPAL